jgi:nitrite reductase (NADH) small subunit
MTQTAARHVLRVAFPAPECPPGARRVIALGRRQVVVFNAGVDIYAIFNRCPHQQAPLATEPLTGTIVPADRVGAFEYGMENCIVRCPWHRYEFDVRSGVCLSDPRRKLRVATYDVRREGDEIAVYNRRPPGVSSATLEAQRA